ncbi:odorant receptor 94b [Bombyx mori]|uniref:Odorant receptor n=1 Tax=Bombyx mori TaxID=7091 RepID=A0A8R2R9G1_BOMMO|nr:uncharacterized protein LOC110385248 [Bombyx mori]
MSFLLLQFDQDSRKRLEGMMTEIPQLNLFLKCINLNLRSSRVDHLHELLNDPIFAAKTLKDKQHLIQNKKEVTRFARLLLTYVTVGGFIWPMSFCFRRIKDPNTVVPFYVPFTPDNWTKFILQLFMLCFPIFWVGYGHVTLDCLIVTYYAQAQVQLKIIKYNLENLFESTKSDIRISNSDVDVKNRFLHYVKRFDKVNWLINEVTDIFNPCLTFQFFTSSVAICMVIYKLSDTYIVSLEFVFLLNFIFVLLTQMFIYCYYGNVVSYESKYINTSLYLSDWSSASPGVRKMFLIVMPRWTRPLVVRIARVVPLSLDSFVSIVKSSYTLYTILVTKNSIASEEAIM